MHGPNNYFSRRILTFALAFILACHAYGLGAMISRRASPGRLAAPLGIVFHATLSQPP